MKFILRIALTWVLLLNIGCLDDGTDCGSLDERYLDIVGINGTNVAVGNSFSNFITLGSGITLTYSEFGIRAIPEAVYKSQIASEGGFRAYACSPAPPQPTEEIADIAVFSSADYIQAYSSKIFTAGDTLNALFKIYESYSGRIVGLPDFLVDDNLAAADQPFTLQLTAAPQESTEHQFTVHYRLENGEFYEFTTDPITIVP